MLWCVYLNRETGLLEDMAVLRSRADEADLAAQIAEEKLGQIVEK